MSAAEQLAKVTDVTSACRALAVPRSSLYRARRAVVERPPRTPSPRSLSAAEEAKVLETLNSPEFVDKAPACVFAELVDAKIYMCSVRTMYQILDRHKLVRERRNQLRRPAYTAPELLATEPNQLWSWDITKLKGPGPYQYFHLYTLLDVYSRFVVGWVVADRENNEVSRKLIAECCAAQRIQRGTLTIHADNGAAMTAKALGQMLEELGVAKSHSRPHVSNDNPFIESHFRTLKYRPTYPKKFGCLEDSRAFLQEFYHWYNYKHRHSGIAYLTPAAVHDGQASTRLAARAQTLAGAYAAHPERFVRGAPRRTAVPDAVWINPPKASAAAGGVETMPAAASQRTELSVMCAVPQAVSEANSREVKLIN
jgi:putative transposase